MSRASPPDFFRDVHCVLGLPFDALSEPRAVDRIRQAAASGERIFLSTPNLNFAMSCLNDASFRDSVVNSDLSTVDGAPILMVSRLLGIPLTDRVSGANLFERLLEPSARQLGVYFFGGPLGAAEAARQRINADPKRGMRCVGHHTPGFGDLDSMSGPALTAAIDASGADFVVVALGAKKGQAWIERNWPTMRAPVISHLGAVVNFAAGTVRRSPVLLQRIGLEWLWRIKEEPTLWRRYWHDGVHLLQTLLTGVLPMRRAAVEANLVRPRDLRCGTEKRADSLVIHVRGDAGNGPSLQALRLALTRACADSPMPVMLDLADVTQVGSTFVALAQLLDGWQRQRCAGGPLLRVPGPVKTTIQRYSAGYLLNS